MSTGQPSAARSTSGQRAFIGAAILVFALASAYLALVIITRVDSIFFPGNQFTLPSAVVDVPLPGVDSKGESGSKDRINILVMGLDKRAQDGDAPSRTDTIFIVTVDPVTKSSGILGIPRDLLVDIPFESGGSYEDRVNTVYVAGELNEHPNGGGVGLMKEVILDNFNIKIDKHVIVDFEGFEEVIDALGGIEVDVPDYVNDPFYSETELPGDYFPQEFEVGTQHMDGRTALAYSRIRFSSDDLDRIQRQQRVIFAVIDKAKSINVLSNAPSLWSKYKDAISTDIGDAQIAGYALLGDQVKDNIHAVSLGPATVPYTTPQGAAVLVGDPEAIAQIVNSLFVDQPGSAPQEQSTPDPVLVEVQNGTSTEGLAARVVAYIAARGHPPTDLASANVFDDQPHDISEIIDIDGTHEQDGYALAAWLDIDPERYRVATASERAALEGRGADVFVILGDDEDFDALIQSAPASEPDSDATGG